MDSWDVWISPSVFDFPDHEPKSHSCQSPMTCQPCHRQQMTSFPNNKPESPQPITISFLQQLKSIQCVLCCICQIKYLYQRYIFRYWCNLFTNKSRPTTVHMSEALNLQLLWSPHLSQIANVCARTQILAWVHKWKHLGVKIKAVKIFSGLLLLFLYPH